MPVDDKTLFVLKQYSGFIVALIMPGVPWKLNAMENFTVNPKITNIEQGHTIKSNKQIYVRLGLPPCCATA